MRVTYRESIEEHKAHRESMMCALCHHNVYQVVEQLDPKAVYKWSVRCPNCGHETGQYEDRGYALAAWRR